VGIGEQQYQVRLTDRQPDEEQDIDEVADLTMKCLWRTVPAAVPGIAFLSGGQSAELASARLNTMNHRFKSQLRGHCRFRLPAPSSSPPWNSGGAKRPT